MLICNLTLLRSCGWESHDFVCQKLVLFWLWHATSSCLLGVGDSMYNILSIIKTKLDIQHFTFWITKKKLSSSTSLWNSSTPSLPWNLNCPSCCPSLYLSSLSCATIAHAYLLALLWDATLFGGRLPFCCCLQSLFSKYLLNDLWDKQFKLFFLSYMHLLWNIRFINTHFVYILSFLPFTAKLTKSVILPRFIVTFSDFLFLALP